MSDDFAGGQLRKYVLGAATEDECDAIERAYFERAEVLDGVSAVEDDLIDDYLSGRLGRKEREQFERHYLATPPHRRRLAVARAIRTAASAAPSMQRRSGTIWWAAGLAAAVIILVAAAAWLSAPRLASTKTARDHRGAPAAPVPIQPSGSPNRGEQGESAQRSGSSGSPRATPTVVTLSISPILVRGADEPASLTIGRGTDIVQLLLKGDMGPRGLGRGLAVVRTVAGREIWRGPAEGPRPGLARVNIPAGLLGTADYIVELRGMDAAGTEVESHRYFLRVRAP